MSTFSTGRRSIRAARATSAKASAHLRREGLSAASLRALVTKGMRELRPASRTLAPPPRTSEGGAVAAGWELVDVQERLGERLTASAFAPRLEVERARGRQGFASPNHGDLVPPAAIPTYESASNLARTRRVLDLLSPGDRVLEIGTGRGWPAERYLREGEIASYHGLEILDRFVAATRQTLELNGHAHRATVEQGDLFDLTREQVAALAPSLVICCEVLEHVPNPERALRTLADALPDGTELLITVPLLGRLERVWGHLELFGAARLRAMLADAGLHPHFVEPLHNAWVFVLASRSAEPSPRAARAVALTPTADHRITAPADRPRHVRNKRPGNLAVTQVHGASAGAHATAEKEGSYPYLRVTVGSAAPASAANGRGTTVTSGCAIDAPTPLRGLRLELDPPESPEMHRVHVDFHRDGGRIGRWSWNVATAPSTGSPVTAVIREHHADPWFHPQDGADLAGADHVEVLLEVTAGSSASLRIRRLGWID